MMRKMKLKVVIEPGEVSGYVGSIPALPGCVSQGRTKSILLRNLREAAAAWLEVEQDKTEKLAQQGATPETRHVEVINL